MLALFPLFLLLCIIIVVIIVPVIDNLAKWLRLLTRAVDEDVAILPDEELIFKVKPKSDPLNVLPATDYSTSLKVSGEE